MLTRKQLETKTSEMPSTIEMVRRACCNLRRTVPASYQEGLNDDELRLRFTEDAALNWIESHIGREDRMSSFLKNLGFDWGDVRELKEFTPDKKVEEFREGLIEDAWSDMPVSGPTAAEMDDARIAMRLIERWFSQAVDDHGDCIEEFIYAHSRMMNTIDPNNVNNSQIAQIHRLRKFSDIMRCSVLAQWLVAFAWIFTGSAFWHAVFGACIFANGIALILNLVLTLRVRSKLEQLHYFNPSYQPRHATTSK